MPFRGHGGEKIKKEKRTKHYMGCHVVGRDKDSRVARRLQRHAPGSAVARDCCFGFASVCPGHSVLTEPGSSVSMKFRFSRNKKQSVLFRDGNR